MKTSELSGVSLDWAVAKCRGVRISALQPHGKLEVHYSEENGCDIYSPSANWAQGGVIIEVEGISIQVDPTDPDNTVQGLWSAYFRDKLFNEDGSDCFSNGMTPLEAAMRCYVTSKLGGEVEIPKELTCPKK